MHPSTISRTERHVLVGPHLPKAFSCTPVHGNIASSHESTVHSTHITYRGWSCRKTRANSVHRCCRKLPRASCCTEARAHHSNSSVLQLPSAAAVHSPKQLVVAVTVCSTPARSCCILPSSYCLQHPLLVLRTHSTLYNCWPVFLPGNCSCYLWRVQLCSNNPRAPNEIRIISILSSIFEHTAKLGALPILSNKKE
jgi:hypothetical protein